MARRRHHRRKNPSTEDMVVLGIGVVGGALGMYVYMKGVQANATNQLTAGTTTTTSGTSTG